MKKQYFTDIHCIEELKAQYKELAMKNHPDRGGNLEAMQTINNEYDELFAIYKDIHKSIKKDSKEPYYTANYQTAETAGEFRDIIEKLIIYDDINIELCGRWVWVTGNTKEHREILKSLKFRWCSKKVAWSWHKEEDGTSSRGNYSMDAVRMMYGSVQFKAEEGKGKEEKHSIAG